MLGKIAGGLCAVVLFVISASAEAGSPGSDGGPWDLDDHAHYLALGDSLSAGVGALPVTESYPYLLYREGVYERVPNMTFASAAVPGATSDQVLNDAVPLVKGAGFLEQPNPLLTTAHPRRVITMTVGGNDLLAIVNNPSQAQSVIQTFSTNLAKILAALCNYPNLRIYVGNLYDIQNFPIRITEVVLAFNQALSSVVDSVNNTAPPAGCPHNVKVADLYSQFSRDQRDLLVINRKGADKFEVHPTNAGYRAIERAFIAVK